jgi:hypothetical protein
MYSPVFCPVKINFDFLVLLRVTADIHADSTLRAPSVGWSSHISSATHLNCWVSPSCQTVSLVYRVSQFTEFTRVIFTPSFYFIGYVCIVSAINSRDLSIKCWIFWLCIHFVVPFILCNENVAKARVILHAIKVAVMSYRCDTKLVSLCECLCAPTVPETECCGQQNVRMGVQVHTALQARTPRWTSSPGLRTPDLVH